MGSNGDFGTDQGTSTTELLAVRQFAIPGCVRSMLHDADFGHGAFLPSRVRRDGMATMWHGDKTWNPGGRSPRDLRDARTVKGQSYRVPRNRRMSSHVPRPSNTQASQAYQPEHAGVRGGWRLVIAALFLLAPAVVALRPVCRPDAVGADEWAFGVRHQKHGAGWLHCEPWIRRVLTD